jgi:hypothetical protein
MTQERQGFDGSPHCSKPSIASLLSGLICDARELFLQELTAAKLELKEEVQKTKRAALALATGIAVTGIGVFALVVMLVHILHEYTIIPLWGCYGIVGGIISGFGLLLLSKGKNTAEKVDFVPRQTAEAVKEDVRWIKDHTISARAERKLAPQ